MKQFVEQLRPRPQRQSPLVKMQRYISEEMTPEAEIQRAIELAELLDTKVASIDAQTQLKGSNKNRITITQVVNDKDRIKFAALAKEIIDSEPITTRRCSLNGCSQLTKTCPLTPFSYSN